MSKSTFSRHLYILSFESVSGDSYTRVEGLSSYGLDALFQKGQGGSEESPKYITQPRTPLRACPLKNGEALPDLSDVVVLVMFMMWNETTPHRDD